MNRQDLLYVIELFFIENFPDCHYVSSLSGLHGPHITVESPYFNGIITLQKRGERYALIFNTYGYKHAFDTIEEFRAFMVDAYKGPKHAIHTLHAKVGGHILGNAFVKALPDDSNAYVTEVAGGFLISIQQAGALEVMSIDAAYDDVVSTLGG